MRKLPIAAAALAALITVSVLSANAEPSDVSTPAEEDQIHYCRTLLGDEEQLIYDALLECALSEDPSETGEEIRIRTDPSGEEFKKAFRRSYNALLYDHPELFWLAVSDSAFQYSYHRQLLERDYYRLAFKINGEFPGRNSQVKALEKAAEVLGQPIQHIERVSLADSRFGNAGMEPAVIGKALAIGENALSEPIQGNTGVFMVRTNAANNAADAFNAETEKAQLSARFAYLPYQAMQLIEEKAEVTDNRANFQ